MLANKRVWKEADNRQDYTGMGTTIVAALVNDQSISFVSAGDSRAYRLRGEDFRQMTVDDSWSRQPSMKVFCSLKKPKATR